jgi:hypothetical protein
MQHMLLLQPLGAVDFAKHAEMQLNRHVGTIDHCREK